MNAVPTTVDEYMESFPPHPGRAAHRPCHGSTGGATPRSASAIVCQRSSEWRSRHFGAFKNHLGLFPPVEDPALLAKAAQYAGPKGNLQFPYIQPLPLELIAAVVHGQSQIQRREAAAKRSRPGARSRQAPCRSGSAAKNPSLVGATGKALARAPVWFIIRPAGQAPSRRQPLSSNVGATPAPFMQIVRPSELHLPGHAAALQRGAGPRTTCALKRRKKNLPAFAVTLRRSSPACGGPRGQVSGHAPRRLGRQAPSGFRRWLWDGGSSGASPVGGKKEQPNVPRRRLSPSAGRSLEAEARLATAALAQFLPEAKSVGLASSRSPPIRRTLARSARHPGQWRVRRGALHQAAAVR